MLILTVWLHLYYTFRFFRSRSVFKQKDNQVLALTGTRGTKSSDGKLTKLPRNVKVYSPLFNSKWKFKNFQNRRDWQLSDP